jgi:limonene-1,2-epoxide hydrolase
LFVQALFITIPTVGGRCGARSRLPRRPDFSAAIGFIHQTRSGDFVTTKQEAVVLGFLSHFTGAEWPDIDMLVASFSVDSVNYVLFPTTKPVIGRDRLKEELVRQAKTSQTPLSDIKAYASSGKYVFVERVDSFVTHGIKHTVSMNSVFEVNSDNLISAWREYFDSGDVARQLHMSADDMGKLLQG